MKAEKEDTFSFPFPFSSFILFSWTVFVALCAGAAAEPLHETFYHDAMGTVFTFTLYARSSDLTTDEIERVADKAFDAIDDLENRISSWRPTSQVSYINDYAAQRPVVAAPDVIDLLLASRRFYDETGGAFDVTVGPLVALWGFYKKEGHLPSDTELKRALANVGMDKVLINKQARTVAFTREGVRLDFGGIGKGFALDRAADIFKRNKVTAALLDAGSSTIVALGAPPNKPGWTVRIRDPFNDVARPCRGRAIPGRSRGSPPAGASYRAGFLDEVVLRDQSLSTSGGYEKFFDLGGKKYCHIFDPHTGKPVEGMSSATSITPTGTDSDALSTAFFVMGVEKTRQYCRTHPGIRAIMLPTPRNTDSKPAPIRIGSG